MNKNEELDKVLEEKFITPINFSYEIEKIVLKQGINYIDAILFYCERESIEVESVSSPMTKPLKEKLKVDATRSQLYEESRGKQGETSIVMR